MLNQVLATRAVGQHGDLQLARHVQLVVTGKDDLRYLLFLVALGDQVAAQYLKPALTRPDLFPQVGRAVTTGGVHRITGSAIVTQVEGQKYRGRSDQLGDHRHLGVADSEVNQRTGWKRQQRLGRLALGFGVAVKAVLVNGVANALGEVGLQFHCGHRQAVQKQHQVDAVFAVQRVAHLAYHAQAVGRVTLQDVGVDGQRGFELCQRQRAFEPQQLHTMAQYIQGTALVKLVAQPGEQGFLGFPAVVLDQRVPGIGLRGLHPGQHISWEQGAGAVVSCGVAFGARLRVKPAAL